MTIDLAMQSAHRRAIAKTGETVTFQRVYGAAPRVFTFSASVGANVQRVTPDSREPAQTGLPMTDRAGITQNDRLIIVVAADLAAERFPLPVKKNDKIILSDGTKCSVSFVDPHKRQRAGAIEITATEVA